jgi:SAM-dependent methyltransferase
MDLLDALRLPGGDLHVERLTSRAEHERAIAAGSDRRLYETLLQEAYGEAEEWYLPAVCQACQMAVALLADRRYSITAEVNFRERMLCGACELNTRQRFMAHLVRTALAERPGDVRTYLHEQVTPFWTWATANLPGELVGSEYLGHDVAGGTEINGIRHEDALALSFQDASLDVIVSNDVLEHVPDIDAAVAEAARVLRPGGSFFFSIPFHSGSDTTVKRAELRGGEVVELLEPQYHGNPLSEKGSLVFYDHGWDILDRLRGAGFADAALVGFWSALYGYLGGGLQTVFAATRA